MIPAPAAAGKSSKNAVAPDQGRVRIQNSSEPGAGSGGLTALVIETLGVFDRIIL